MDPLFDFTGKVALVTGGSRGLGYQMVKAFAERGADVIIASRKLENCEAVAEECRALGRKALAVSAHVGKWAECDRLIEEAYAAFGRVDILVNNAGMSPRMPSHEVTEELFDSVVNLNFKGPFRLASQIAKRMYDAGEEGEGGGCIINVTSSGSMMPLPADGALWLVEGRAQRHVAEPGLGICAARAGQHTLARRFPHRYRRGMARQGAGADRRSRAAMPPSRRRSSPRRCSSPARLRSTSPAAWCAAMEDSTDAPRRVSPMQFGPPESYQLREFDPGPPGPGQLRVRSRPPGSPMSMC